MSYVTRQLETMFCLLAEQGHVQTSEALSTLSPPPPETETELSICSQESGLSGDSTALDGVGLPPLPEQNPCQTLAKPHDAQAPPSFC